MGGKFCHKIIARSLVENIVVFLGFLNFFVYVGFSYMQITVLLLNK